MINNLEKIAINNSTQWVLVRGNLDAPLLIHVQYGPGAPMISEANEMEKNLHLENDFLVAYWDQRGCGLSYSKDLRPESINLTQMSDDVIALTKYLLGKYNKKKALIAGYSIGATVSIMAAAKDSSLFSAIVATGTDVDVPYANEYCLDFAMTRATTSGNKKLIQKIEELKSKPIASADMLRKRAQILTDLGGIRTGTSFTKLVLGSLSNMLFSKHYGVRGLVKGIQGLSFCQDALISEMNLLNMFKTVPKLSVPIHFAQGDLDVVTPPLKGKEYFEQLVAPRKTFTLFSKSAHMPQYEEPEKFSALVKSVAKDL